MKDVSGPRRLFQKNSFLPATSAPKRGALKTTLATLLVEAPSTVLAEEIPTESAQ